MTFRFSSLDFDFYLSYVKGEYFYLIKNSDDEPNRCLGQFAQVKVEYSTFTDATNLLIDLDFTETMFMESNSTCGKTTRQTLLDKQTSTISEPI